MKIRVPEFVYKMGVYGFTNEPLYLLHKLVKYLYTATKIVLPFLIDDSNSPLNWNYLHIGMSMYPGGTSMKNYWHWQ